MDAAHEWSTAIRRYGWAAYAGTVLVFAAVLLLGGRTWQRRFMWASLSVLAASAAALVVSWPLYEAFVEFDVRSGIAIQGALRETYLLIADKVTVVLEQSVDEFIGGIRWWSGVLLVMSFASFLCALLWRRIVDVLGRVRR